MTSEEQLISLKNYIYEHPELRFWQALRNWSGYEYIIARKIKYDTDEREIIEDRDTFYLE